MKPPGTARDIDGKTDRSNGREHMSESGSRASFNRLGGSGEPPLPYAYPIRFNDVHVTAGEAIRANSCNSCLTSCTRELPAAPAGEGLLLPRSTANPRA